MLALPIDGKILLLTSFQTIWFRAMQPKTSRQFGWFGLLMIAIVSGLVVKILGDPIVEVIHPKLEDVAEDAEEFLDDQEWGEKLNEWLDQML